MKRLSVELTLAILLLCFGWNLQAQLPGGAAIDNRAEDLVNLGKRFFKTGNYLDAAITFDLASQRPYNSVTTYSIFMSGLSYFQLGEMEKAAETFNKLEKDFPKSKFQEDAIYHHSLALMASERVTDRENGLDRLFLLMENTRDSNLRDAIEDQLRDHLCNKYDLEFLDLHTKLASTDNSSWFIEAACYQLDRNGKGFKALERIKTFEQNNGILTNYLAGLKAKYQLGGIVNSGKLNVAIFLSLNLHTLDTARAIPKKSLWATEMLEGMKIALDSIGGKMDKQINVLIFDTRGDTALIRKQIDTLNSFDPDIILGDVRSALARPVSDWAEENKVLHLIPRNPIMSLVANKKYTFLAHPALETHGTQMALHAYYKENKRNFLIFNDHSYVSERFSNAFKEALDSLDGVKIEVREVAKKYDDNRKNIPSFVKSLKYKNFDVIYIPLSSEESAGLIISQLNYHRIDIPVMGGPDWEVFTVIDPELKTKYDLKYSTFYYDQNNPLMFDRMTNICLKNYYCKPSNYTIQGFDIMAYLLELSKTMNEMVNSGELVRQAPVYHGIHQDFYYGGTQNNQLVNIVQFQDGKKAKINWNTAQQGTLPKSE